MNRIMNMSLKMKSRSVGATSMLMLKSNKKDEPQERIQDLNYRLSVFENAVTYYTTRGQRITDLMSRKSSSKWTPEKSARMLRRFQIATESVNSALSAISLVKTELDQLQTAK